MNKKYFFIGLFLFYFQIILSPNKIVYFSAYFVAAFFFYLGNKDIKKSILYVLILSIFSEMGIANSWFLMEPKELNLYSGWMISPMTLLITTLLPFSIKSKIKLKIPDILILLFLSWIILILIIYSNVNILYGVTTVGEVILAYFLLRVNLEKKDFRIIYYLFISFIVFQSLIGGLQFLLGRPIGITAELSNFLYPEGLTASEDSNIFRITGTFSHANLLAIEIATILPFIFLIKNKFSPYLIIISLITLLLTASRSAWAASLITIGYLIINSKKHLFTVHLNIKNLIFLILMFLSFLYFLNYLLLRLGSIPLAFTEGSSMDTRFKLIQESLNLIQQYPLIGVGLNRFQEVAGSNSVTNIFMISGFSGGTKLHNLFLEICTETGIAGLFLFVLFLGSVFNQAKHKENYFQKAAFLGLFTLIIVSQFHPLFQSSQFRLFFLLSAVILT